jgi:hypothetical protein
MSWVYRSCFDICWGVNTCRPELGLHCGELIAVFVGVTYNQEAEDNLLEHIKSCEQAESKGMSILVLSIAIISFKIEGGVMESLGV